MFRPPGSRALRNKLVRSGERTLVSSDIIDLHGLSVTTPLRTALDQGRLLPRDRAIGSLDALLRTAAFTRDELVANVERFKGQRGVRQLRELAPLADARAESFGESALRLRWLDLPHLPRPTPQIEVRDAGGCGIYRIDLGVEELRFGVEYDGEAHHTSTEDLEHDHARRQDLAMRFGWLILPVTKANLFGVTRDIERLLHDGIRDARRRYGRSPSCR